MNGWLAGPAASIRQLGTFLTITLGRRAILEIILPEGLVVVRSSHPGILVRGAQLIWSELLLFRTGSLSTDGVYSPVHRVCDVTARC